MSLERTRVVAVDIQEPGSATDAHGNPVEAWSSPTTTSYRGYLEQTSAIEVTVGRDTVISDWLLVLPANASASSEARAVIEGSTFEVVGRPDARTTWRGPHHLEVRLRLLEG